MNNYYELLLTDEWKLKRNEILNRDEFKCQSCANKSLISDYRISYCSYGTLESGTLLIIVYDKNRQSLLRCKTTIDQNYLKNLIETYGESSIICLSHGDNAFCRIVGLIITDEKLDYPGIKNRTINNIKEFAVTQQITQELYLNKLPIERFKKLKWLKVNHLHIHHKYYTLNKNPWEYPNEALQTLCWKCHEELHKNSTVPVYNSHFELIDNYEACQRCHGAGYFPQFSHVQAGICFQCNGNRFLKSN
jgi:hypothetical protein